MLLIVLIRYERRRNLDKVSNDCYCHVDNLINFMYYPLTGLAKAANSVSFYRCIEHFAYRGFAIDWVRSNINTLTLFIIPPECLSEEESIALLSTSTQGLYNQSLAERKKSRDSIISKNIDNNNGKVITENQLKRSIENLIANKSKGRQDVIDWFNRYNIEDIRPEHPLMVLSTKPKKTLFLEGKTLLMKLFEEGKLKKLTKEEYLAKMELLNN